MVYLILFNTLCLIGLVFVNQVAATYPHLRKSPKCYDCTGVHCQDLIALGKAGTCQSSSKCFIRQDPNQITYYGCADVSKWPGLDNTYTGCSLQKYGWWNKQPVKWCFCSENYCNGGVPMVMAHPLPNDEVMDDYTNEQADSDVDEDVKASNIKYFHNGKYHHITRNINHKKIFMPPNYQALYVANPGVKWYYLGGKRYTQAQLKQLMPGTQVNDGAIFGIKQGLPSNKNQEASHFHTHYQFYESNSNTDNSHLNLSSLNDHGRLLKADSIENVQNPADLTKSQHSQDSQHNSKKHFVMKSQLQNSNAHIRLASQTGGGGIHVGGHGGQIGVKYRMGQKQATSFDHNGNTLTQLHQPEYQVHEKASEGKHITQSNQHQYGGSRRSNEMKPHLVLNQGLRGFHREIQEKNVQEGAGYYRKDAVLGTAHQQDKVGNVLAAMRGEGTRRQFEANYGASIAAGRNLVSPYGDLGLENNGKNGNGFQVGLARGYGTESNSGTKTRRLYGAGYKLATSNGNIASSSGLGGLPGKYYRGSATNGFGPANGFGIGLGYGMGTAHKAGMVLGAQNSLGEGHAVEKETSHRPALASGRSHGIGKASLGGNAGTSLGAGQVHGAHAYGAGSKYGNGAVHGGTSGHTSSNGAGSGVKTSGSGGAAYGHGGLAAYGYTGLAAQDKKHFVPSGNYHGIKYGYKGHYGHKYPVNPAYTTTTTTTQHPVRPVTKPKLPSTTKRQTAPTPIADMGSSPSPPGGINADYLQDLLEIIAGGNFRPAGGSDLIEGGGGNNANSKCVTGSYSCTHICIPTGDTYRCGCNDGYYLDADKFTCIDKNECLLNNGGCSHICVNTPGSYRCQCRAGFRLNSDGTTCTDFNECGRQNGGCSHYCENTPGSFRCSCRAGYRFQSNGYGCIDINECLVNNGGCEITCTNTPGSYICSCDAFQTLDADRHQCIDGTPCPAGFIRSRETGSCYLIVSADDSAKSVSDAEASCKRFSDQATLINIETRAEQNFIERALSFVPLPMLEGWQGWWTGGHYDAGAFRWRTGGAIESNWGFRKPPEIDTCVWILQIPIYNYTFGNFDCETTSGHICEIPPKSV